MTLNFFANPGRPAFIVPTLMLGLLSMPLLAAEQAAAPWPTRSLTLVVTYPPGGGADAMARLIAPKLSEALGQNVLVDNRGGGSSIIGSDMVATHQCNRHCSAALVGTYAA